MSANQILDDVALTAQNFPKLVVSVATLSFDRAHSLHRLSLAAEKKDTDHVHCLLRFEKFDWS